MTLRKDRAGGFHWVRSPAMVRSHRVRADMDALPIQVVLLISLSRPTSVEQRLRLCFLNLCN